VSGISEIQTFNAQSMRSRRFHEVSERAAKSDASIVVWMQGTVNGSQVFVAISTVVVLLVGIGFSASFGLTFAGLMVFTGMVPTMFGAAQRVLGAYTTYHAVAPNVASTYELLDTRPSVQEPTDAVALGDVHGNLVFEDVTFGYRQDQVVLDGLSFSIAEGETVALVGGIGSGKSTVFNLLLRFLDPQRGRILLDGHDIAGVTIASLRDQVSKLAQFPFFTKDTIRREHPIGEAGRHRRRCRGGLQAGPRPLRHHRPDEDARRLRHGGGRAGAVRRTEATHRAGALPVAQARSLAARRAD
jgi:ATP-binding cassette subfamily B protein